MFPTPYMHLSPGGFSYRNATLCPRCEPMLTICTSTFRRIFRVLFILEMLSFDFSFCSLVFQWFVNLFLVFYVHYNIYKGKRIAILSMAAWLACKLTPSCRTVLNAFLLRMFN